MPLINEQKTNNADFAEKPPVIENRKNLGVDNQ